MSSSRHAEALATRAWARELVELSTLDDPLQLVGSVVLSVAEAVDGSLPDEGGRAGSPLVKRLFSSEVPAPLTAASTPPGGWANPWLPGAVHEQAVSNEARSARGAWYTPESVVRGLVALATDDDRAPEFAADPTCGGGAFLLAVLDRLVALGITPADAVGRVAGLDIDAGATTVSRWSVVLWAARAGVAISVDEVDVTVGDALVGYPAHWPDAGLIVGNPPFATPLRKGAVPVEVERFRQGREELLGPYTDLAAMHLLAAVENRGPGSVVALVQPQSMLSSRDTRALREYCDQAAPIHGMWAAREPVFDAGVRACAAVLRPRSNPPSSVVLASGPDVNPLGEERYRVSSWSGYAARALGAPTLPASLLELQPNELTGPRLGSLATATAGFRDEYYGLVAACSEWQAQVGQEPNRLLTVGSVEPLATKWGVDECRFGRQRWIRPCIDVAALDQKVRSWTDRQLLPKVVLATQSKILEPLIDRTGTLVPATPLIAVHGDPDDLSLIAAVLLAPPVVAWAWQRWFGAALAVDALKLAARQVLELPLPIDTDLWQSAAAMIDETEPASVAEGWSLACEVAALMNRAYGADDAVLHWWLGRAGRRD
ncbi:MAG: N-6 DNA methylase [Acidimicrobiales bacterium]